MAVLTVPMTLVQAAKQGDKVAFMSLLEPSLEPGYRLACGMLHDSQAAEDAVQEAAFKAWRRLGQLREGHELRPWFLGIVANECRTVRRSRWWSVLKWPESEHAVANSPDSTLSGIEGKFQLQLDFIDANHGWLITGSASDFDAVPGVALPLYRTDD